MQGAVGAWLIWGGVAVTLCGLVLLVVLIRRALHLRRQMRQQALPETEARAVLTRLLPLNFAALALSFLGLLLVGTGVLFG